MDELLERARLPFLMLEGRWSAAFALVGLAGLPVGTLMLERRRAPKWQVVLAVVATIAAVPVLLWVQYRAFKQ